jgi:hypothetical protein
MPFEHNNTLGGRKQGSLNTATQHTRIAFKCLLENNLEKLQQDIDSLKPKERLEIILKMAAFVVPTLKSIEVTNENENGFNPVTINLTN